MTLFERLRAFFLGPGLDMGREPDLRYGRMAVEAGLATLDPPDDAWLMTTGDAWSDKAPPTPNAVAGGQ